MTAPSERQPAPERRIPQTALQRFEYPIRRAAEIFRNRAARLRARFEPVGAEQEQNNAADLDDLLRILDPVDPVDPGTGR